MKKGLSLFLTLVVLIGLSFGHTTFAQINENRETLDTWVGTVASVSDSGVTLEVKGAVKNVTVNDETVVIDAQTGQRVMPRSVQVGEKIAVYYTTSESNPNSVSAKWLLTELRGSQNAPKWVRVDTLTPINREEVQVLDKDQNLLVTLQKEKPLFGDNNGQMVTFDDIKVGTKLLIWYDAIAMSSPALTYAQKAFIWLDDKVETPKVIWPEEMEVKPVKSTTEHIKHATLEINGQKIDLGKYPMTLQNGNVMVPVRTVGEAVGFSVVWNPKIHVIHMKRGPILSNVIMGQDGYFRAKGAILGIIRLHDFGAKPQILNGTIYVPVALFNLLFEDNQAVQLNG